MERREENCLNKVRYESKEEALRGYKGYLYMMQRNRGHRVNKQTGIVNALTDASTARDGI